MKAKTVTVEDIKNLFERKLVIQMPDFQSTVAARVQVSYVRRSKQIPEGLALETSTDSENNIFTVAVVEKNKE